MNLLKSTLLILSLTFLYSGCATRLPVPAGVPEIGTADYESLVEKKTRKVEIYEGLYNKLTVSATWLDSVMSQGSLAHSARLSQWQEAQFKEEKSRVIEKHTNNSEFFISFYTPERKHADLSSRKTSWKIFLDVNGQRYEGKATKIKMMLSEIQALYPHHNRWSYPYSVLFSIPTSEVENKPATLTVTGTLGSAQVKFE